MPRPASPAPAGTTLSMTGYGAGTAQTGGVEATVEVRTVNGRGAEVSLRTPRALAPREAELAARVRERIGRGTATVSVQTAVAPDAPPAARLDAAAVRAYADTLRALRDAAGVDAAEAPITIADLLRTPAAFADETTDAVDPWPATSAALDDALDVLDAARAAEGARLADDLALRLDTLDALAAQVEARAPVRVAEARARLAERLATLLAGTAGAAALDPARLDVEIALLADRLDVTEETVRLRSHLAAARDALAGPEPAGRRLGFLVQELLREVNTTGSKANDAETTRLVVAMKETVEQIREQALNLV